MIKKKNIFNKHWSGIRAVAVAPTFAFNSTNRAIGISIMTLRDTLPKDVKGVLTQVGKAGFSEVETLVQ
jgi:hypothetical protein